MYPVGIRVIKVSGRNTDNIGKVATVVMPTMGIYPGCDMCIVFDEAAIICRDIIRPAGYVFSAISSQWRPINPDADDETKVEDKELEHET